MGRVGHARVAAGSFWFGTRGLAERLYQDVYQVQAHKTKLIKIKSNEKRCTQIKELNQINLNPN